MNDLWSTKKNMEATADTDIIKKSLESERFFNLYKRCFPRSFKNEVIQVQIETRNEAYDCTMNEEAEI